MSEQQLQALLEKIKSDSSFKEKLNSLNSSSLLDFLPQAGVLGLHVGLEQVQPTLSEEELEGVSAGRWGGLSLGIGGCDH